MSSMRTVAPWVPLAALAFAAAHIGFEYFTGGVKTHHFLARGDLPGFSNWLGLLILPLLGSIIAIRVKSAPEGAASSILSPSIVAGMAGSLVLGAALAASFHFGLEQVSFALFLGLILMSIGLPVYRAEYIFGFVVGMTIIFGSVIPLVIALVLATLSYALRRAAMFVLSIVRKARR
jgi:hypothetical protein